MSTSYYLPKEPISRIEPSLTPHSYKIHLNNGRAVMLVATDEEAARDILLTLAEDYPSPAMRSYGKGQGKIGVDELRPDVLHLLSDDYLLISETGQLLSLSEIRALAT